MTTTIEVGMLGFGTVGSGVVLRLTRVAARIERTQGLRLHLAAVAVSHLNAPRAVQLPLGTRLTDSIADIVDDPRIQLVIEVMGTVATAKRAIIAALVSGKSVVTANKDLMATAGDQLLALARRHHCDLFYEASVAGGIPILRTLTDSYVTDTVTEVTGIINGTANYILSAMTASGRSYQHALTAAQRAGYAETDPTNDVTGLDAAYKLMILSRFAFGQALTLQQVAPVGITNITTEQCQSAACCGWQIKLLAEVQRHAGHLYCRVAPVAVPTSEALGQVVGVQNAVAIQSEAIGASLYTGPGAGSTATANSVLSDVIVAAQHLREDVRATVNEQCGSLPVINIGELPQAYLAFSASTIMELQYYANEADCSIRPVTANCYQLTALTAAQRQRLQARLAIQLIPIMGTEVWSAPVDMSMPSPSNVAI